jgi:hypothetical protein
MDILETFDVARSLFQGLVISNQMLHFENNAGANTKSQACFGRDQRVRLGASGRNSTTASSHSMRLAK